METHEYQTLYELEESYWWYVARRRLVKEMLERACGNGKGRKLLDIGCGTGANAKALEELGTVLAADASEQALQFCRARGLQHTVASLSEQMGVRTESLDVVTALDVLEHVDRDVEAMREILRVLKPGGFCWLRFRRSGSCGASTMKRCITGGGTRWGSCGTNYHWRGSRWRGAPTSSQRCFCRFW